ncbi:MAG: TusE/DsrC/DsvC family sulfur relay protein [Planctomycetota bacterium]
MPRLTIAGKAIEVDDEGYMVDPALWDDAVAIELAKTQGIDDLSEEHWTVVRFMREKYSTDGSAPSIRSLGKESGISTRDLYRLFPRGPAKLAALIGGIPKPDACV